MFNAFFLYKNVMKGYLLKDTSKKKERTN